MVSTTMDLISSSSPVFATINGGLKLSSEVCLYSISVFSTIYNHCLNSIFVFSTIYNYCLNLIFVFYKEKLTYNLITQPPRSRSSSKSSSADRSSAFFSLCNQTCRIYGLSKLFMWIYCKSFHFILIKTTFPF